jgi:thiol-disulfide isomerase/thioredoxin
VRLVIYSVCPSLLGVRSMLRVLILLCLVGNCFAEVVDLTTDTYSNLVDNAVDNPKDWLIMFYAPWCEYSKKLAPTLEEVSDILYGEVNVGKIDVSAERKLGSKFEVPGFPVIKIVHLGKSYTFKGRRSREELVEFARNGYQIHQPEDIRATVGLLSDVMHIYKHANKQATKDLLDGKFFSLDVYLTFLPVIAIFVVILLLLIPVPKPYDTRKNAQSNGKTSNNNISSSNRGNRKPNAMQKSPFDVVNGRKPAPPTSKLESSVLPSSKYD